MHPSGIPAKLFIIKTKLANVKIKKSKFSLKESPDSAQHLVWSCPSEVHWTHMSPYSKHSDVSGVLLEHMDKQLLEIPRCWQQSFARFMCKAKYNHSDNLLWDNYQLTVLESKRYLQVEHEGEDAWNYVSKERINSSECFRILLYIAVSSAKWNQSPFSFLEIFSVIVKSCEKTAYVWNSRMYPFRKFQLPHSRNQMDIPLHQHHNNT